VFFFTLPKKKWDMWPGFLEQIHTRPILKIPHVDKAGLSNLKKTAGPWLLLITTPGASE